MIIIKQQVPAQKTRRHGFQILLQSRHGTLVVFLGGSENAVRFSTVEALHYCPNPLCIPTLGRSSSFGVPFCWHFCFKGLGEMASETSQQATVDCMLVLAAGWPMTAGRWPMAAGR